MTSKVLNEKRRAWKWTRAGQEFETVTPGNYKSLFYSLWFQAWDQGYYYVTVFYSASLIHDLFSCLFRGNQKILNIYLLFFRPEKVQELLSALKRNLHQDDTREQPLCDLRGKIQQTRGRTSLCVHRLHKKNIRNNAKPMWRCLKPVFSQMTSRGCKRASIGQWLYFSLDL